MLAIFPATEPAVTRPGCANGRNRLENRLAIGAPLTFLAVAIWYINAPGVFATDSLISWYEGRIGVFRSNQQPLLGVLWSLLDRVGNGASELIFISCTTLVLSCYLIARQFAGPGLALAASMVTAFFPSIFSQLTLINKETVGGNALLLCVALLLRRHRLNDRWWFFFLTGGLAAFAVLIRYQYVVVVGALFLLVIAVDAKRATTSRRATLAATAAFQLVTPFALFTLALVTAINFTAFVDWKAALDTNRRLHLTFEMSALLARSSNAPLPVLVENGADIEAIRVVAARYTPDSNISLFPLEPLLKNVPTTDLDRQVSMLGRGQKWVLVQHHLQGYLALLGFHDVCWPVQKSLIKPQEGSEEAARAAVVGLASLKPAIASMIYHSRYFPANTFLFRPVLYLVCSIACIAIALLSGKLRRCRQDMLILSASGPIYILSFLPITPSCDFRYAYWLVTTSTLSAICLTSALCSKHAFERPVNPDVPRTVVTDLA